MNCLEMIRHFLEGEHLLHKIEDNGGNIGYYVSPWIDRSYSTLPDEVDFEKSYREHFLATVNSFIAGKLTTIEIIRSGKGQRTKLGDYIQRIAYYEAVHARQVLSYYRILGLDRL